LLVQVHRSFAGNKSRSGFYTSIKISVKSGLSFYCLIFKIFFKQAEEMFDIASRYLMFPLKRAVADVLVPHLEMASPEELCHWLMLADMYVSFLPISLSSSYIDGFNYCCFFIMII
jgi:hypothetical protein